MTDGISLISARHPVAPWWRRLWARLRHPRNRLDERALETVLLEIRKAPGPIKLRPTHVTFLKNINRLVDTPKTGL